MCCGRHVPVFGGEGKKADTEDAGRLRLKSDGTCAETRFRLTAFEM